MYASLGRQEALYALATDRNALDHIVQPALRHVPDRILPQLLEAAVEDDRELSAHAEHPLRKIESWIEQIGHGYENGVQRRSSLLDALERWNFRGEEARARVALRAVSYVLSPEINGIETDPGGGHTMSLIRGLLAAGDLERLGQLWPRCLKIILGRPLVSWQPIFDLIRHWIYPSPFVRETQESEKVRATVSERMLLDLTANSREHPGLQHRFKELADRRSVTIEVTLDAAYEELWPVWPTAGADARSIFAAAARRFADRHGAMDPVSFAARLVDLEREASLADSAGPYLGHAACGLIAADAPNPLAWFQALRAAGCASSCAEPFLRKAGEQMSDSNARELAACLQDPAYAGIAFDIVITGFGWPAELIESAVGNERRHCEEIRQLCFGGRLSPAMIKRFMESDEEAVRSAVIEGYWSNLGGRPVEAALTSEWRSAVLRMNGRSDVLVRILQGDEALAEDWIVARLDASNSKDIEFDDEDIIRTVAAGLPDVARQRLLTHVTLDGTVTTSTIDTLIGDNLPAYRTLLLRDDMRAHHLRLLEGSPDQVWLARAKMALDAGHTSEEIAAASFGGAYSWIGSALDYWLSREKDFTDLTASVDDACRPILLAGARLARERATEAERREREKETYGEV